MDLSNVDNEPLRHRTGFGLPAEMEGDGYHILAQDSGAGIITHIWATAGVVDSGTNIRIYVDGEVIFSSTLNDFFLRSQGAFRPPLDTALAGGCVNDVQMAYRSGFKITYHSPDNNVYYAISWRRVKDRSKLQSFQLVPGVEADRSQAEAEKRMLSRSSPWERSRQDSIISLVSVGPSSALVLAEIEGSAVIQELQFEPSLKEPNRFRDLMLKIYYDGNPFPAVDAPLYDLFLSATKYKDINALSIKVKADGAMVCYFPMPFARSCRIMLENRDTAFAALAVRVAYAKEPVDRSSQGYFHAYFNESNPTRIGLAHPVLHIRGRGRYVGVSHNIPDLFFPVALEGDPIFVIDSNPDHYIRYTGGEDYYNGGWWFMGTTYSRPFAGFQNWFDAFYRFHYLDAMDFRESFDFDMQHGVNNDVHDEYRTVAMFYKEWTPFWVSRDTIKIGEPFLIQGNGYGTAEPIVVSIGNVQLDSFRSDAKGAFSRVIVMPGRVEAGKYHLSVNNEAKPEWTYVLARPAIRAIADRQIPLLRERDTLIVTGTGFRIHEKVSIWLDSIKLNGEFIVGSDFRFTGVVRMPYLPDREYHVVAIGEQSGQAVAPYPVRLTRTHNFEFENLLPPLAKTSETVRRDNVSFFYHDKWSEQSFVYFEANGVDSFVTFALDVPHTDTFNVFMFATLGHKFGDYDYYLDGVYCGGFKGFASRPYFDPWRSDTLPLGVRYLEEGVHTITFKCTGSNDSAEHAWLGADNIILQPVHALPPAPGTWTQSIPANEPVQKEALSLFPNPSSGRVSLLTSLTLHDSDILQKPGLLCILDEAGRVVRVETVQVSDILTTPVSFDLGALANGRYVVSLQFSGLNRSVTLTSHLNLYR